MKSYLILGGSSGIGLATARKLSIDHQVILVGKNQEKLKAAHGSLAQHCRQGNCLSVACDLGEPNHVQEIFSFLKKKHIRLDGMVYCAGIAPLCLLRDNTEELMERVFHLNLFSFIECCRYFYQEEYSNNGSKIVGVASITAHTSGYRQTLYGASKAAMTAAVRLMAKELLNREIKINCISPGSVGTEMLQGLYPSEEDLKVRVSKMQPLGVIPPERVADAIEMLLSPIADYMTGNEYIYDGGALLK